MTHRTGSGRSLGPGLHSHRSGQHSCPKLGQKETRKLRAGGQANLWQVSSANMLWVLRAVCCGQTQQHEAGQVLYCMLRVLAQSHATPHQWPNLAGILVNLFLQTDSPRDQGWARRAQHTLMTAAQCRQAGRVVGGNAAPAALPGVSTACSCSGSQTAVPGLRRALQQLPVAAP